jgi:hypothetical protein
MPMVLGSLIRADRNEAFAEIVTHFLFADDIRGRLVGEDQLNVTSCG